VYIDSVIAVNMGCIVANTMSSIMNINVGDSMGDGKCSMGDIVWH